MTEPTTPTEQKSGSTAHKWSAWAAAIQIVLLLVIVFQLNGLGNATIQGAAVGLPSAGAPSGGNAPSPTIDMEGLVDDDDVLGDDDAPITIVEFSDYECPFCARFHTQTFGELKSAYIDTGKVKFIYRDFPLSFHPQAQKAAEAAECAGEQDKYFEMHELLFTDGVAGGVAGFKQYASQIGLNTAKFNECLDSGKMVSEIRKDTADGAAIGVQGTPAFYVNGVEVSGAQPFSVFQQIIDGQLAN
ncbi:MAG TPA: thioredoxin domain-containing protein [Candidatus Nanoarchaeia archaeon]|nr:thioredoxin domain-containing protein [Candidatus Nanoarchaeia archaeon]